MKLSKETMDGLCLKIVITKISGLPKFDREVHFIVFFLFRHCIHARTYTLTGARTHASLIALIAREDENTVSSSLYLGTLLSVPFSRGVRGFQIKRNIPIKS